jgi:hypothetical protein
MCSLIPKLTRVLLPVACLSVGVLCIQVVHAQEDFGGSVVTDSYGGSVSSSDYGGSVVSDYGGSTASSDFGGNVVAGGGDYGGTVLSNDYGGSVVADSGADYGGSVTSSYFGGSVASADFGGAVVSADYGGSVVGPQDYGGSVVRPVAEYTSASTVFGRPPEVVDIYGGGVAEAQYAGHEITEGYEEFSTYLDTPYYPYAEPWVSGYENAFVELCVECGYSHAPTLAHGEFATYSVENRELSSHFAEKKVDRTFAPAPKSAEPSRVSVEHHKSEVVSNVSVATARPILVAQQPVSFPGVSAPSVALTQMPYTGLDTDPGSSAFFFFGLILVSGTASYGVLYFRGGMTCLIARIAGTASGTASLECEAAQLSIITKTISRSLPQVSKYQFKRKANASSKSQGSHQVHTGTVDTMLVTSQVAGGAPRIVIKRL